METEFIYWRHATPAGVTVEEISGGAGRSPEVWKQMALQVFGENGRDRYRVIEHSESGAPYLADEQQRISVTHTPGLLCVALLPRTPEADLENFSPRTAMGIDCERADRGQAVRLRERFLSEEELALSDADDIERNVQLWTIKEALYKAALTPGLDFRKNLRILRLPEIAAFPSPKPAPAQSGIFGQAQIIFPDGSAADMQLYTYRSDDYIVTIAFSPKCAKLK